MHIAKWLEVGVHKLSCEDPDSNYLWAMDQKYLTLSLVQKWLETICK